MKKSTVLLLTGGWGDSHVERALDGAHRSAARDLLGTFAAIEWVERIIVATEDRAWAEGLVDLPVEVDIDRPDEAFHFGRRLADLIGRYDLGRVLYTGAGSAPLLRTEDWRTVLERLGEGGRIAVTNNLHSCDWAGFTAAQEAAPLLTRQTNDNGIAWTLANEAGYSVLAMEPSAGSRFDIDTPVDLLIAHRHPGIGRCLRRYLDELAWQSPRLDAILAEMRREGGSLLVAGRVSPEGWSALQGATRCWVRVFAEERGMRASGRQGRGEVRSFLAQHLELAGIDGFFESLAGLVNGVLLDDRVMLASLGLWPSPLDRFNSDLYRWDEISDPFLRGFTRAAADVPVPVVLGGHTVVAGGLMALAEVASSSRAATQEVGSE